LSCEINIIKRHVVRVYYSLISTAVKFGVELSAFVLISTSNTNSNLRVILLLLASYDYDENVG